MSHGTGRRISITMELPRGPSCLCLTSLVIVPRGKLHCNARCIECSCYGGPARGAVGCCYRRPITGTVVGYGPASGRQREMSGTGEMVRRPSSRPGGTCLFSPAGFYEVTPQGRHLDESGSSGHNLEPFFLGRATSYCWRPTMCAICFMVLRRCPKIRQHFCIQDGKCKE